MASDYGVILVPDANKRAANVVLALMASEDPAVSENCSQPANATGSPDAPVTHWFGGRPYTLELAEAYKNISASALGVKWPVAGVSAADAKAACAAMRFTVTTEDAYTTQQAQRTLVAALDAQKLMRVADRD